ncbi:SLC13 family permease [Sediminibacterium sp. TEGAF015]|uniref:SLC13 family permease n=1 Tax=Sediminibacterium sp. TEGAF015 TaxID=575378 RepID=UPI00220FAFBB|nr:SLC13 family permease [Sediminibacterium sp. TEGAF015]BDQ12779.1 SLC13 family permease [Sediminibacterium sp. TEGAF015]
MLYKRYKKEFAMLIGLVVALLFYFLNPLSLAPKAVAVLSIAFAMIIWWVLEAAPLAVVALVPIVLFPMLGIASVKEVTKSYSDSTIFLFMGGFFIALAIEKWNLHKRIALNIINLTGTNGDRIILGFILATCFLSLWLSNTATTMMMLPIAGSVIHVITKHHNPSGNIKNFSLVLMLSIAYASNFALGTIIGTPPNVAYVAHISERFDYIIGFTDWMLVFMPLTIVMIFSLYWVMVKWLYPNKITHSVEGKAYIVSELKGLGKMSLPEKRVLIVFCTTVFFWVTKDLINEFQKTIVLDDAMIAMAGGLSLFIISSGLSSAKAEASAKSEELVLVEEPVLSEEENENHNRLLEWTDTSKMAWGILLMFGGGIALAKALEDANLLQQLGAYIASFSSSNMLVMILVVTTLSVFLSEVMSNIAQVIVLAPVISSVAIALNMDPLSLGIPMTLGASVASMLPMGTPPNAIVFASGHVKIKDMMKTGFVLNIVCIIIITLFCWLLQPYFINLH